MWLLTAAVRQAIENGVRPSADHQLEYEARMGLDAGSTSRILTVAGDVAEIRVTGVMTKAPSFMAMLFGGGNVTYPEIVAALAEADNDPAVARAELKVDSGGGHIDGLFDAIAAIQSFSKPLRGVGHNTVASAAYALISQTDEVIAHNKATRFGSIGVVIDTFTDPNEVSITSTNAPNKRPDLRTAEGRAVVVEELDDLHELFVDAIATGRGSSAEKINADFGQGSMLVAGEALKRGMIDAIEGAPLRVVKSDQSTTTAQSGKLETGPMDLNTLKAQHQSVYAAAVQDGIEQERARVGAHLTMGEASGAMDIAAKAIQDGEEYTANHMAQYNAASLRKQDQINRQADDDTAGAAANGASSSEEAATAADIVCSAVESALGLTEE